MGISVISKFCIMMVLLQVGIAFIVPLTNVREVYAYDSGTKIHDFSRFEILIKGDRVLFWCYINNVTPIDRVLLYIDTGSKEIITRAMNDKGWHYFEDYVWIPDYVGYFTYWFYVMDQIGNSVNSTVITTRIISDDTSDDPFIFKGLLGDVSCGTGSKLKLDVSISPIDTVEYARLRCGFAEGEEFSQDGHRTIDDDGSQYYHFEMFIKKEWSGTMYYFIKVSDFNGSNFESHHYKLNVYDATPPSFREVRDHIFQAGHEFTLELDIYENNEIETVEWRGLPFHSHTPVLEGKIDEPGIYRVNVTVRDTSDHEASAEFLVVIESSDWEDRFHNLMNGLIIIVAIFVIGHILLFVRMGQLKERLEMLEPNRKHDGGKGRTFDPSRGRSGRIRD